MAITQIRSTTYHSRFFLPAYYPRSHKYRYYRKFRLTQKEQGYKRGISLRSKTQRFNPWVYNNKPYVYKPYRFNQFAKQESVA